MKKNKLIIFALFFTITQNMEAGALRQGLLRGVKRYSSTANPQLKSQSPCNWNQASEDIAALKKNLEHEKEQLIKEYHKAIFEAQFLSIIGFGLIGDALINDLGLLSKFIKHCATDNEIAPLLVLMEN